MTNTEIKKNVKDKKKYAWKVIYRDGWSTIIREQYMTLKGVKYVKGKWSYSPKGQGPLFCFKTKKDLKNWGYVYPNEIICKVEIKDVVSKHPCLHPAISARADGIVYAYKVKVLSYEKE